MVYEEFRFVAPSRLDRLERKVVGQERQPEYRLPDGLVPSEAKASSAMVAEEPDSPTARGRRGLFCFFVQLFLARRPGLSMGQAHRGALEEQDGLTQIEALKPMVFNCRSHIGQQVCIVCL